MNQSFCSYCECLVVGQKLLFVLNFPDSLLEYNSLYLGKKSVFGRHQNRDPDYHLWGLHWQKKD